jgi:hypothetical protein
MSKVRRTTLRPLLKVKFLALKFPGVRPFKRRFKRAMEPAVDEVVTMEAV